jgi:peroxidase
VDLLVGALSERAALGTVFGPTLTCLLAIQFANIRNSDRFWYENDLPPSSLSLDQLQAVRRVSLSGLLCEAKGINKAQPKAFIRDDPYLNARLTCDHLSGLDIAAWKIDEFDVVDEVSDESGAPSIPEFDELSHDLINDAIEKAKIELSQRNKMEYETWLQSMEISKA